MVKKLKEIELTKNIQEVTDKRKDKFSYKVIVNFLAGLMIAIVILSVPKIINCGINWCVASGAGIGSVIVTILWLVSNIIKT